MTCKYADVAAQYLTCFTPQRFLKTLKHVGGGVS